MTILVVDDDVQWAHLMACMIRDTDHEVIVAYSMEEAIRQTGSVQYVDLVLLDLTLPDSMPDESLEAIAVFKALGTERVAVVTGAHLSEDLAAKCREAGATDLIAKNCQTFQTCVADVIAGRAVAGGC